MSNRTANKQFKAKELREKRGQIRDQLRKIGEKMTTEQRAMNAEEKTAFEKLKTDFVSVSQEIRSCEADMKVLDDLVSDDDGDADDGDADDGTPDTQSNSQSGNGAVKRTNPNAVQTRTGVPTLAEDRALAFQGWARTQHKKELKREHAEACKRLGISPRAKYFDVPIGRSLKKQYEQRAQSVSPTSAGGYTIPQDFSYILDVALKDFSNVRGVVDDFETATGALMPYPTMDDTSNVGVLLAENTQVAETDIPFNVVNFSAYKYSSNSILISSELMNDSAFDFSAVIAAAMGERIGRAQGNDFTVGTGSNQPNGIVTGATLGVTTASATAMLASELVSLYYKVDPAYRKSPNVGWMFDDGILSYINLLVDALGRPLFTPSFQEGVPDKVMGKPVYPNQFMAATVASSNKIILFGDMSKQKIRDVTPGVRIRRLDERYADYDQVGFIGFLRSDSNTVKSSAIKYLQCHA